MFLFAFFLLTLLYASEERGGVCSFLSDWIMYDAKGVVAKQLVGAHKKKRGGVLCVSVACIIKYMCFKSRCHLTIDLLVGVFSEKKCALLFVVITY